uniref:Beta-defensin-like domain-containing protein n=1 Tax=Gopherus evgoodei TaxID=1825980 RepID=A0A8C4W5W3_9SAUR
NPTLPLAFIMVVFLSAEFSQAWRSSKRCRRAGGFCFSGPCPSNAKLIGICSRKYSCCKLIQTWQS